MFKNVLKLNALLFLFSVTISQAEVIEIENAKQFNDMLRETSKKIIVADFFAKWCGPCKMFKPEFEKLSEEYADKAIFVKIDVDNNQELSEKHSVRGLPTILFFEPGKTENSGSVVGAKKDEVKRTIDALSKKKDEIKEEKTSRKKPVMVEEVVEEDVVVEEPKAAACGQALAKSDIIEVESAEELKKLLTSTKKPVIVDFHKEEACSHCRDIVQSFADLASKYKDKMLFVKVDMLISDENKSLSKEYKIKGYPTIMFFKHGQTQPATTPILGSVKVGHLEAKIKSMLDIKAEPKKAESKTEEVKQKPVKKERAKKTGAKKSRKKVMRDEMMETSSAAAA